MGLGSLANFGMRLESIWWTVSGVARPQPIATNVWRGDNHATFLREILVSALEGVVRIDGASVEEDTRPG
jgi:hypothetical protein